MKTKSICAATFVAASLLAGCKADNAAPPATVTPEPQAVPADAASDAGLLPGSNVLTALPADSVSTPDTTNTCSLDAISGNAPPVVTAKPGQELTFSGWTSTKEVTVPEKILIVALIISVLLLIPMSFVQTPLQLGILRFLLGAADGALLPAVQTLLVYNSTSQISGRIFSYNQSFRDIGNVTGPLIGASVSANYGFRAVFLVTAGVVLFNAIYSTLSLRRPAAEASQPDRHSVN